MQLITFFRNQKIAVKLNLIITVGLGCLLLAGSLIGWASVQNSLHALGQHRTEQETALMQHHLTETEQNLLAWAKIVAANPQLIEAAVTGHANKIEVAAITGAPPFEIDNFDVIDLNKRPIYELSKKKDATQVDQTTALLNAALQGIETTGIVLNRNETTLQLAAVVPLRSSLGDVVGGLLVSRQLDDAFLKMIGFPREDINLFLISEGQIIAQAVDRRPEAGSQNPSKILAFFDQAAVQQALNGRTIVGEDLVAIDGVPHSMSYLPLTTAGETEAIIAILVNLNEIFTLQSQVNTKAIFIAALFVLIVLGGITIFTRQNITIPLNKLNLAAEKVARGDLSSRAEVNSRDEIGLLAACFNKMSDRLTQTLTGLEERVASRTAELTTANSRLRQEIIEREQVEAALRESEVRFRRLVEHASDGLFFIDYETAKFLDVNQQACLNLGYSRQELLRLTVPDINTGPETYAELYQNMVPGVPLTVERVHRRKDGTTFPVEIRAAIFEEASDGHQYMVALARDISERKQTRQALQQANIQLRQHVKELAMLNRTTQTITSTIDFKLMLASVAQELVHLFEADTCDIALLNSEKTELTIVSEYRIGSGADSAVGIVLPLADNPFSARVIESGKPDILPLAKITAATQQSQEVLQKRAVQCLMVLPLLARGQVIGTIGVVDTTQPGREFTLNELRLAETISGQIAGAIENAQLFDREHRQRQIAESLREVSTILNGSLNQETILNTIFVQLENVIEYDGAGLFLQAGGELELRAGRNLPEAIIGKRLSLQNTDNPASEPFRKKQPVIIADVYDYPHWQKWPEGPQIRAWMGAPLLFQEQAIGMLTVDNLTPKAYLHEDAQILQAFANQAAIAIQNARLYAEAQREIAQRKKAQKALALARDQALEVSRLKSELLAKVSHELRTPLGAILGYIELLQDGTFGPLSDEQVAIADEVIDSAEYLSNLVNDLLDQAQLESGKVVIKSVPFLVEEMINQIDSQMKVLAQAKGLSLTTIIAPDVPPLLAGDQRRLHQILVNLVGNAIKFTEAGGVQIRIYRPDVNHWAVRVSDTGIGIPQKAQALIFEPFGQVDGTITREYDGAGLGLSIVKQLITLIGGNISLTSEIGQGSVFTVLLPLIPIQEVTV